MNKKNLITLLIFLGGLYASIVLIGIGDKHGEPRSFVVLLSYIMGFSLGRDSK
jgi:hypothetical protein